MTDQEEKAQEALRKGTRLIQAGKLKEAIKAYDELTSLKPDYAEACFRKGLALGRYLGRY